MQKEMKRLTMTAAALIMVLLIGAPGRAQVTIGASIEPNKGAFLDLKQRDPDANNTTSDKGLLLPRVQLTDLTKLYPMLADVENAWKGSPENKSWGVLYNRARPSGRVVPTMALTRGTGPCPSATMECTGTPTTGRNCLACGARKTNAVR
jgi:hypothetical protein